MKQVQFFFSLVPGPSKIFKVPFFSKTESYKNRWESLTALGTLSIINNEEEDAIKYFQDAIAVHQTHEVRDETYLQVEKMLKNKIEITKKRIELTNSFKSIQNDLTQTVYDDSQFLVDGDMKTVMTSIGNVNSIKRDMSEIKRTGSVKKGIILKHDTSDDTKKPLIFKRLSGNFILFYTIFVAMIIFILLFLKKDKLSIWFNFFILNIRKFLKLLLLSWGFFYRKKSKIGEN
jgi:hypothetical protein